MNKFECSDCGCTCDVECEEQAEAIEAGDPQRCADCDEERAAEAKAESIEAEHEAREFWAEKDGDP